MESPGHEPAADEIADKPKRRRGRPVGPKYLDDFGLLLIAALVQLNNKQFSRFKAITQLVTFCWGQDGVKGNSVNAVEKRLLARLEGKELADFYDAWVNDPDTRTLKFNTPSTRPGILSA
jgi:hypothetical protein